MQAIPILNDALSALDTIKEADIAYIKKLTNPPSAIKLVLEAVCVVLDVKPVKVRGWQLQDSPTVLATCLCMVLCAKSSKWL